MPYRLEYGNGPSRDVTLILGGTELCVKCCRGWLSKVSVNSKRPGQRFFELLQLCVLRLGFFQDGDVGVGVFPEREEVLVCTLRFGGVAGKGIGPAQLQARQ